MCRFVQCGLESLDSGVGETSPESDWMVKQTEGEASREQVDLGL